MQQFSTQTYHEMRHWIHSMTISKGKAIIIHIITTDTPSGLLISLILTMSMLMAY